MRSPAVAGMQHTSFVAIVSRGEGCLGSQSRLERGMLWRLASGSTSCPRLRKMPDLRVLLKRKTKRIPLFPPSFGK